MMRFSLFLSLVVSSNLLFAQFDPPAGQAGSHAIVYDSPLFMDWAVFASPQVSWANIMDTTLGKANTGNANAVLGPALSNGVLSLGDGGSVILQFNSSIFNGDGYDFAVFENSFSDDFLELAFVEVSSDGVNFVRFPATSYTQTEIQVDTFGLLDATKINNLAGKYRAGFGTPFDLEELMGNPLLDVNRITHIKIIDVVGSIQPQYATYDQYGNIINDPFPTPFPQSGFDLDAVGVIHSNITAVSETEKDIFTYQFINQQIIFSQKFSQANVYDALGRLLGSFWQDKVIYLEGMEANMLFVQVMNDENEMQTIKIMNP